MRSLVPRVVSAALLALFGCSLAIDTSDLDTKCAVGWKMCGTCVEEKNTAFGCGPKHCDPCPFVHGIPFCDGDQCTASRCLDGFGCDKCATNLLTDELNCGSCGTPCDTGKICSLGVCVWPAAPP